MHQQFQWFTIVAERQPGGSDNDSGAACKSIGRVCGIHFFHNVAARHRVRPHDAADQQLERARQLARRLTRFFGAGRSVAGLERGPDPPYVQQG